MTKHTAPTDWTGAHLISAKTTDMGQRRSEASRLACAIAKIKGTHRPTAEQRKRHGAFITSAVRQSWRIK